MSKLIYICAKDNLPSSVEKRLQDICINLAPDNIAPPAPKIVISENIAYGVMNPASSTSVSGTSILLGQLFEENTEWADPFKGPLDGSYALFRHGKEQFEIVSDPAGSRTIWYFLDKDVFIASTSQRAITMFIGNFQFNEKVIPWMLSTGSLGPSLSWDKRIERVPPDSSIILNKKEWSLTKKENPIEFTLREDSDDQHEQLLRESLVSTFESLHLDFSSWVLPLSGGYDSRSMLCLFRDTGKNIEHLRTITWGLEASLHTKGTDAYVARELANTISVSHKYFHTDLPEGSIEKIVNRFILLGEGRIDHLSGYMDGFEIWKTLFKEGIQGIIRGDEGFGWGKVSSPLVVRYSTGCALCSDFSNLKNYQDFGLVTQEMPPNLIQREGETLAQWRDRLYHEFRLPTILSSLSDLKLPYVEVINPLLSRKILQQVRQGPDHLRTEKILFKKIVTSLSPEVDIAASGAIESPVNILMQKQFVNLLKQELSSKNAMSIFPDDFLDYVSEGIRTREQEKTTGIGLFSLKEFLKRILPRYIKNIIRDNISLPIVNPNILAFRVFLTSRMNAILNDDSTRLSRVHSRIAD